MFQGLIYRKGNRYQQGKKHGEEARKFIDENTKRFWQGLELNGYGKRKIISSAIRQEKLLSTGTLHEIKGIADGSGFNYEEMLAFNLYHGLVLPEECTVMVAVGAASASGSTIFAKNSDKIGDESLIGDRFYQNKEINVILFSQAENGTTIVGVAAAGATGYKIALNDKGVAAGTNIARTRELAEKKTDVTQIRAVDRAQLIRDGLEYSTPLEATTYLLEQIAENPMATPGNVQFAGAEVAYLIEGSYDRLAVKKVIDDIDSRANGFVVLQELNHPEDLSTRCRYVRTQQMLREAKGNITVEVMKNISVDHTNGPGPNSICRHGHDYREETSLAAGIMEIDPADPKKSLIHICLGKPCHAWSDRDANITLRMDCTEEDIPIGFRNGEIFKKYYTEEVKF